jgi:serine protease AprX
MGDSVTATDGFTRTRTWAFGRLGAAVGSAAAAGAVFAATAFGAVPAAAGTTDQTLADLAQRIGVTTAWSLGLTGRGVGVALIDTGVAPVPGLPANRVVDGPDLSFESQASTLRYLDSNGHGTHLAGIIAGQDPATGYRGIASGATLTSVKVASASGAADVSQVLAAVDWVVEHQ